MWKKILGQVHTVLLLIGLGLIANGLFLLGPIVGYIGAGVILSVLAIYINETRS